MEKFRILSIDGGGVRGIIPAIFLAEIARLLDTDDVSGHFDLITGTSTGAVIAAVAPTGQDIGGCIEFYKELGPEIFPPLKAGRRTWRWPDIFTYGPSYEGQALENAFQRLFGMPSSLSDAKTNLVIPSYDVLHRQIFLMRSYDPQTSGLPVWEACKASCSAPTYFPAHILHGNGMERPLIDGGVFCNNPSMLGIAEAIRISQTTSLREFQSAYHNVVVSLGTGSLLRSISIEDSQKWGMIRWVKPLIDVLLDATSEMAHISAKQIVTGSNYARMQVDLSNVNDDLDDASQENIRDLEDLARAYLATGDAEDELNRIVQLLS
ncbi:hypothetical protein GOL82_26355 [Sinorhizobium medicae]|nr:hypothetical protein [Sinorhizobium medicae]MDX0420168.1 hypothetical protein [Sinorhizobium medicae]MDX1034716.1 hypothetical protein [Sinorhizobium medicae]